MRERRKVNVAVENICIVGGVNWWGGEEGVKGRGGVDIWARCRGVVRV